jgi:hypothetical protein
MMTHGETPADIVYSSVDLDKAFKLTIAFAIYTPKYIYMLADSRSSVCVQAILRNPPTVSCFKDLI